MFRGNDIGLDKGKGDLWQIRGTQFRANALKGKRSKTRRGCATATRSQNLQIGNFPSPHQTLPRLLLPMTSTQALYILRTKPVITLVDRW